MFKNMPRVLFLFALCFSVVSAITNINELDSYQKKILNWIKQYTVPNTLDGNGNAWTKETLPEPVRNWKDYDSSIKPGAYAAAIVTAWSLSEQENIFECQDFYRVERPNDQRCKFFEFPAQLPPKGDFPLEIFSYSLCQGKAVIPDPKTNRYYDSGDCSCSGICPGQLIGPNQKCDPRDSDKADWQNGMWGMEQSNVDSAADVARRAENIYHNIGRPEYTYVDVLDNTLTVAGFGKGTEVYDRVMSCFPIDPRTQKPWFPVTELTSVCADLTSMWLVRNHLVGLTVAITDNQNEWLPANLNDVQVVAEYYNN